jgi:hypothetical protein
LIRLPAGPLPRTLGGGGSSTSASSNTMASNCAFREVKHEERGGGI